VRFIGKWLVWIGGLALLYVDLRPLVEQMLEAYRAQRGIGQPLETWLLQFARPVFVLGVLCAAAMPEPGRRKARRLAAAAAGPAAPVSPQPPMGAPPAQPPAPPVPAETADPSSSTGASAL
jgi:hypothetical protein